MTTLAKHLIVALSIAFGTSLSATAQFSYVDNNPPVNIVPYGGTFTYSVTWSATFNLELYDLTAANALYTYDTYYPQNYTFTYTINGVNSSNDGSFALTVGNFSLGYQFSTTNVYLHISPAILTQPQNTMCVAGTPTAMGIVAGPSTATFQWFNTATGGSIDSASSSPVFTPTTANSGETVYCKISNAYGSVSSANVLLTVGNPPTISAQPTNVTATFGGTATFSVTGTGSQPIYYQWYSKGLPVSGATLNSITIGPITPADIGGYTVMITNAFGSTNSVTASLIGNAPAITQQPTNANIVFGNSVTFSVAASGTQPLNYQWYKDGLVIQGANLNYITLPSVTNTDAGSYQATVSNQLGQVNSSNVTLNVGEAITITNEPASLTVTETQNATFNVGAYGSAPIHYQWVINGSTRPYSATNASYTITNALAGDNGYTLSVTATNLYSSVASSNATLTVYFPPRNLNVISGAANLVNIQMAGTPGFPYVLFESTNLFPPVNWQAVCTNNADENGNWIFADTNASSPAKFYRAAMQ